MDAHKIGVKIFAADPSQVAEVDFVPVFHSWIQLRAVEEHLAIDVASYHHVQDGPGTVLITHEANFGMDFTGGRAGLLYQRKQPLPGTLGERIVTALRHALAGAARLESYPGIKFRLDEIVVRVADRLNAPNTAETFAAVCGEMEKALTPLLGKVELVHVPALQRLFEVTVKSAGGASAAEILGKMGIAV